MEKNKNISIIGFMASGKSTIGKVLAKRVSYKFLDTDSVIEENENRTISSIFETDGEAYFRDAESEAIKKACFQEGSVISTGGGAVLRQENVDELRKNSVVVWLRAGREAILKNLKRSEDKRPLMKKEEQEAKVDSMLLERAPKYEGAAHVIVDIDGKNVESIVGEILFNLEKM